MIVVDITLSIIFFLPFEFLRPVREQMDDKQPTHYDRHSSHQVAAEVDDRFIAVQEEGHFAREKMLSESTRKAPALV